MMMSGKAVSFLFGRMLMRRRMLRVCCIHIGESVWACEFYVLGLSLDGVRELSALACMCAACVRRDSDISRVTRKGGN